jgi:hypothetical protein
MAEATIPAPGFPPTENLIRRRRCRHRSDALRLMRMTSSIHRFTVRLFLMATAAIAPLSAQTNPAPAEEKIHRIAIGGELGTTGYGPVLMYSINRYLTVSGGHSWLDVDESFSTEADAGETDLEGQLDVKLKLSNTYLQLNLHPFAGSFRLSAGAYDSDNTLSGSASAAVGDPNRTFDIGNNTYRLGDLKTIEYEGKLGDGISPFASLGWSKEAVKKGVGLSLDFGVIFTGTPTVDIRATGSVQNNLQFIADVAKEKAEAQKDLESLKVYPVAKISLFYRF